MHKGQRVGLLAFSVILKHQTSQRYVSSSILLHIILRTHLLHVCVVGERELDHGGAGLAHHILLQQGQFRYNYIGSLLLNEYEIQDPAAVNSYGLINKF